MAQVGSKRRDLRRRFFVNSLAVFSDYECSVCRDLDRDIRKILAEPGPKVRWTIIHYPLSQHPMAIPAAVAARCAALQGHFWEFHGALMASPLRISKLEIERAALVARMDDPSQFAGCTSRRADTSFLAPARLLGGTLNIRGTPLLVVNDVIVRGSPPTAQLRKLLGRLHVGQRAEESRGWSV